MVKRLTIKQMESILHALDSALAGDRFDGGDFDGMDREDFESAFYAIMDRRHSLHRITPQMEDEGMATTRDNDTGYYNHAGEEWHVVQRENGGVVCHSARYMTAANKETWQHWKVYHGWERIE